MTDPAKSIEQRLAEIIGDVARAERERIAAILNHPEAAGRRALAEHVAFNTAMTVELAGTLMAVAGRAQPPDLHVIASSTNADGDLTTKGQ